MSGRDAAPGFTVFGVSAHAFAIAGYLEGRSSGAGVGHLVALIADEEQEDVAGTAPTGMVVLSFARWAETHRHLPCFVGDPRPDRRKEIVERIAEAGGCFRGAYVGRQRPRVVIGAGSIVGDHSYICSLVTIGDHVQVSNCVSVGHDVTIGNYSTIGPSCAISGYVAIEEGCSLGAGSVVVPGRPDRPLRIGRGASVAPGSVIIKSVPPGARMAGNPARPVPPEAVVLGPVDRQTIAPRSS